MSDVTQSSQSVLINGFGVLFVVLNSFGLGLRLPRAGGPPAILVAQPHLAAGEGEVLGLETGFEIDSMD